MSIFYPFTIFHKYNLMEDYPKEIILSLTDENAARIFICWITVALLQGEMSCPNHILQEHLNGIHRWELNAVVCTANKCHTRPEGIILVTKPLKDTYLPPLPSIKHTHLKEKCDRKSRSYISICNNIKMWWTMSPKSTNDYGRDLTGFVSCYFWGRFTNLG